MFKIAGSLRTITLFALLVVLLFVYANMPDEVSIFRNPTLLITRNFFFYGSLAIAVITNGLFYFLAQFLRNRYPDTDRRNDVLTWINGFLVLMNIFFITALIFLNAFNSLENLNLNNFGMIMVVIIGSMALWTLGIFYVFLRKHSTR